MFKRAIVFLIEIYQTVFSFDRGLLKVLFPVGACKYNVSCSEYAKRQITEKGVLRGSYLGLKRILSCW